MPPAEFGVTARQPICYRSKDVDEVLLIIGAGVAGLTLARTLVDGGVAVQVLDKGKKPGGRCATRRLGGQVIDYGPIFLHGSDSRLLSWFQALDAVPGWPIRVAGHGAPCHPGSLERGETRLAPTAGVNALPARLAEGLPIELGVTVDRLALEGSDIVAYAGSTRYAARTMVLTAPAPQARALLLGLPGRAVQSLRAVLGMAPIVPCLSLALAYPLNSPAPDWDVLYPSDSLNLTLMADETEKRPQASLRTVVMQASPAWSAEHLEEAPELWSQALLRQGARHHPALGTEPLAQHPHRWRYARLYGAPGLRAPLLETLPNGARLGLAGEVFDPKAGIEGAFRSGLVLGHRLLGEARRTS